VFNRARRFPRRDFKKIIKIMEPTTTITPEQSKDEVVKSFFEAIAQEARHGRNITIRTGEAHKVYDPESLHITGVIDSPLRWLEKRKPTIDLYQCSVIVDRDNMSIGIRINEHDHFADTIYGKLTLSQEFQKFGINSGEYTTGLELSDLIRMNRSCFESKAKAMELVTIMRNFKATITKEIEVNDDKKGNRLAHLRQVIDGNQPPAFDLVIPIFKGQPRQKFTVEIDIDPDTLKATLVSPDAQDLIADTRDVLMNGVISKIEMLCPEIPIIEI
jgi:hypothetical protein